MKKTTTDIQTTKRVIKMYAWFEQYMKEITEETVNNYHVFVSDGNTKTHVPSVSLAPAITCMTNGQFPPCWNTKGCYAFKSIRFNDVTINDVINTVLAIKFPSYFWAEVDKVLKENFFVRFHVDGDIPNYNYMENLRKATENNKHCTVMTYTKKYAIVNRNIKENGNLPKNLVILFSEWEGLPMDNPYNLPVAFVYMTKEDYEKDERKATHKCGRLLKDINGNYVFLTGNCLGCALNNTGCWAMKKGDKEAFLKH